MGSHTQPGQLAAFTVDTVARVVQHSEGPHTHPLGAYGPQILNLLFAAYTAGLQASGHAESRTFLVGMLDGLGVACMACDTNGVVVHRTPVLLDALSRDLDGSGILEAMQDFARRTGCELEGFNDGAISVAPRTKRLQTRMATYQIRTFLAYPQANERNGDVVVSLEVVDDDRGLPSMEALRSGFGLTPQQARVAFLLAERRTDKEIADLLSISPFTVRRHVEEILSKLEIHTRRDVGRRLKGV